MKTKFFKVLLVLLAISLLIIPAGADSNTASNAKLEAVAAETVNLDAGVNDSVQVHVVAKEALTNLVGIEGSWSTAETEDTSYFKLTSISLDAVGQDLGTHNFTDIETGKLLWTDDLTFIGKGINAGGTVLTATYEVSKDTPDGEYTVTFTSTALITGSLNNGFDYDQDETVYEATITVVREHDWNETTYAGDGITAYTATRTCKHNTEHVETVDATITHTVKTPATCTSKGWTTYNAKFNVDWADDKTQDVQDIEKDMSNHTSEEIEYVYKDGDTHTVKHTCCGVTEEPVDHDFTNGDCVCGKKKGLKGDVDLDGDVDIDDFAALARHIGEVDEITDSTALFNADVANDGVVDINDFAKLAQYIGEIITDLN